MFFSRQNPTRAVAETRVRVLSQDAEFVRQAKASFGPGTHFVVDVVAEGIEKAEPKLDTTGVGCLIIDLDARRRDDLLALQRLMSRIGTKPPVIVVTEAFDEAVARWFLQIRVADFLLKPVDPVELARTTMRALAAPDGPQAATQAQIFTFLPAAGGVGVTTIAIQTAFLLQRGERKGKTRTCLIDLDFQTGVVTDYLDLEPRLLLEEIVPNPERLDAQLLKMMISHHPSGLSVIAAANRPAEMRVFEPAVVMRLLDLAAAEFDNVIIDLPRTWFPWTDDVLLGSDDVFIVTEMTVPGIRLARRLGNAIRERLGDEVKPRAIVNRFEQPLFGPGLRRSDIEAALGATLGGTVANNYKLVREAIDRGVPLEEVKPSNNVLQDLRRCLFPGEQK